MEKPLKVKPILESLHDSIVAGEITYRDAAVELYRAGWFNFIPDKSMVKSLLKIKEIKH